VQHLIREFKPNGSPALLMGYITDGRVDPKTTRMYPIIGGFIGAALPDEIMRDIAESVATRLTKLYEMSKDNGEGLEDVPCF
jgi:hypothetical protein